MRTSHTSPSAQSCPQTTEATEIARINKIKATREHCLLEIAATKDRDLIKAAETYITKKDRPAEVGSQLHPKTIGYSLVTKELVRTMNELAERCEKVQASGDLSIKAIRDGLGLSVSQFQLASAEFTKTFGGLKIALDAGKPLDQLFGEVEAKHCRIPLDPGHSEWKGQKMLNTDPRVIAYWNQVFTDGQGNVDNSILPRLKFAVNKINRQAVEIQKNLDRLLN